jgi:DNA (cytosine-5)-methyltransferase 1
MLLASPLGGLAPDEKVADLFCGAGGWGEGARELGIAVDFAINHDPVAIAAHVANNPGCKHHQGDAWRTRPRSVVGNAKLGLLLASAACTTHSRARGSAPISKRVHMLGWCIARWMEEVQPRVVLIENVPEWKDWGPTLVRDGVKVQDPARKGQHFRKWWRYCERLGYRMEMRVLDAPDYGCASRRRRLFIIARRDGQPIVWPEKTHGSVEHHRYSVAGLSGQRTVRERAGSPIDVARNDVNNSEARDGASPAERGTRRADAAGGPSPQARLRPNRTAAECIDWSDLGTSIFERPRPLRPKTLARIAEGIRRYVLQDPSPFVLRVTQGHGPGAGWHVWPASGPMPTQTTRQDVAVATPVLTRYNGERPGDPLNAHQVSEPLYTVPTENRFGLATPILATTGYGERDGQAARVHRVAELLGTAVDGVKQAVVCPVLMNNTTHHTGGRVDGQVPTVTTGGQGAVVAPVMAYLNHGGKQVGGVDEPLRTVVSGGGHAMLVAALLTSFYGNNKGGAKANAPLGTVTTLDRHGLVCVLIEGSEYVVVDILFRMLRPMELARAMGFRPDYVWPKTQRETVRLIGNAVAVPQARALVGAVLPRGRTNSRKAVRA